MASALYRIGTFSFRHRWAVLLAWIAVLAALLAGAAAAGLKMSDSFTIPNTESDRAQQLVVERLGDAAGGVGTGGGSASQSAVDPDLPSSARIVVGAPEGESLLDDNAAGLATVLGVLAPLAQEDDVTAVSDPVAAQAVAPDGSVMYVDVQLGSPADDVPAATVTAVRDAEQTLEDQGYTVAVTGGPFTEELEILGPTESLGVIVALAVLIVTFGSLLAAGMPIVTALLGVGVGAAGVLALSATIEISSATLTLALMLGLAVGIDYALFLLTRHRQQLAEGMTPVESLKFVEQHMVPFYPLGDYKVAAGVAQIKI